MKEIILTQGKIALVDDEDFDYLNQFKWYYQKGYAARKKMNKHILMHRDILLYHNILKFDKQIIDHIDHNTINNKKENLRICTNSENSRNQIKNKNGTSKYKGVDWKHREKKYRARICVNYKNIHLGFFEKEKDAARAYNEAAVKYHGSFANLNVL